MSYFKENKWMYWLIAFLVILNVSTIAMLWMQNNRHHKRGMEKSEEHRKDRMAKALKLSDAQKEQFHGLKETHREKVGKIWEQIHATKKQKITTLTTSPEDSNALLQLDQKVANLHLEMEQSLNQHYNALSALCSDEQKELLKKRFQKLGDKKRHKRGGRR